MIVWRVTSPAGAKFYVALVEGKPLLSTRDGAWAPETKLQLADLVCPSQTMSEWDVNEVNADNAPTLPA